MNNNKADKCQSSQENSQEHEVKQESDFFNKLQTNEREKGKKARGNGHGWTTFAEILMSDW
jgi:hypothetical protein